MIEIGWNEKGIVMGSTADWGDLAAVNIWPHEKGGWSWCVITDDAEEEVPQGWDPTLEAAKKHSESAYLDWRDVIEGRKAVPDEHDETADIVAEAVAQERAAVVAWLHHEAIRNEGGAIAWEDSELRLVAGAIERGEHRREGDE